MLWCGLEVMLVNRLGALELPVRLVLEVDEGGRLVALVGISLPLRLASRLARDYIALLVTVGNHFEMEARKDTPVSRCEALGPW